ncbi:MAG: 2-C-methyl-D-erythritol 4-phosphate cytidylyltransferase, partial [Clostridia bacterium]|nr:2-C-methyl-D-erythritol 4-phosphate cytidylyltransferase [Clostridia bacterium]
IVAREEEIPLIGAEIADLKKVRAVVVGGECRAASARLGFLAARDGTDLVAIHDGARCLITPEIINRVVDAAISTGAASAGSPVTDTVKKIDGDMNIISTVNRDELFFTSTPQVFSTELYERALLSYAGDLSLITDDNMILESIGVKVRLVDCGKENIKITTAEDVRLAEFLIEKRLQDA